MQSESLLSHLQLLSLTLFIVLFLFYLQMAYSLPQSHLYLENTHINLIDEKLKTQKLTFLWWKKCVFRGAQFYMLPILLATSKHCNQDPDKHTFFSPSGLIRVLTWVTSMCRASSELCDLALVTLTCVMNTVHLLFVLIIAYSMLRRSWLMAGKSHSFLLGPLF